MSWEPAAWTLTEKNKTLMLLRLKVSHDVTTLSGGFSDFSTEMSKVLGTQRIQGALGSPDHRDIRCFSWVSSRPLERADHPVPGPRGMWTQRRHAVTPTDNPSAGSAQTLASLALCLTLLGTPCVMLLNPHEYP